MLVFQSSIQGPQDEYGSRLSQRRVLTVWASSLRMSAVSWICSF